MKKGLENFAAGGRVFGLLLLIGLAGSLAAAPLDRPSRHVEPRLSWSPYEYLRQGYRNAPWVKDPFYPEQNGFRLSGVISNEMAFINGKWLRVGDKIDGFEVRSITGKGVTLRRQGELIVLRIEQ
jgi:hypothetical protein